MIHFDFIVEDNEAEAIFDCINQEICKNNDNILDLMDKINTDEKSIKPQIAWFKLRNIYLKELKNKMNNYQVKHTYLTDEDFK